MSVLNVSVSGVRKHNGPREVKKQMLYILSRDLITLKDQKKETRNMQKG